MYVPSQDMANMSLGDEKNKSKSTWTCPSCSMVNLKNKTSCGACNKPKPYDPNDLTTNDNGSKVDKKENSQYPSAPPVVMATVVPVEPVMQTVQVPISANMSPGQTIQIRAPDSNDLVKITVPSQDKWITTGPNQYAFHAKVPKGGGQAKSTPQAQAIPQDYPQSQGHQQQMLKPLVSYDTFQGFSYRPPDLRMRPVQMSPYGQFVRPSGRRKALIIGINYENTRAALRGCQNDAKNMSDLLRQNGYPDDSEHMVILTDKRTSPPNHQPTGRNIIKAIQWLVQGASHGDILFFHFSGHGSQQTDHTGTEEDGLNETILPSDYRSKQITDDELWGTMVFPLPNGVKLIALMDCCNSGTGLDLPFEYKQGGKGKDGKNKKDKDKKKKKDKDKHKHNQYDMYGGGAGAGYPSAYSGGYTSTGIGYSTRGGGLGMSNYGYNAYGAPPPQGAYGAPPQGAYGAPPPQGAYGAPPYGGYGAPSSYNYDYNFGAGDWSEDVNPAHSEGDVCLFSGCEDGATSADVRGNYLNQYQSGGAMTQAFIHAYRTNPMPTHANFMASINASMRTRGFRQKPQLSSSQRFHVGSRIMSLTEGIEPNKNPQVGRMKRRHFRPKHKYGKQNQDIAQALGVGVGLTGLALGILGGL